MEKNNYIEDGNSILRGLQQAIAYSDGDFASAITHKFKVEEINVKKARESLGLSQDKFAKAFGVSPATVRNWEQGRRTPQGAAKVLLNVIAKNPSAVLESLHIK